MLRSTRMSKMKRPRNRKHANVVARPSGPRSRVTDDTDAVAVRDGAATASYAASLTTSRIVDSGFRESFAAYADAHSVHPLFLLGNAEAVLRELPSESVDFCMTSPPYWGKRSYAGGGIGLEPDFRDYITRLCAVLREVKRVLKAAGSFWLNIGDTYSDKRLMGIPWRVALVLTDEQGWILRDDVVWHKVKGGPDNATDRLRNVHEPVFHFVKTPSGYYFDADAIRADPRKTKVVNGAIVSASGVTGVRYRRQVEMSTALTDDEKEQALTKLSRMLQAVQRGDTSDFRMIIRGQQRTTHSDSLMVSGRARELHEKGFYFLRYHPNGSMPADVWDILPEDTQGQVSHFAPYPVDLCRMPIRATCPPGGIVLDPFCGTGTTMLAARNLGRRSVGIDIAEQYLAIAAERCASLL